MVDKPETTNQGNGGDSRQTSSPKNIITPPSISLPKGGGAIRGMGEKFAANPVTGTGSITVPIAMSPRRSGMLRRLTCVAPDVNGTVN